ncbi:MAG: hypothetical protein M3483_00365 [Gemmatimonadota bacterium]|nr:hypothetical protein [Gemmatimonadota bacterium]
MIALILCVAALAISFAAGRRSLAAGLIAVLGVGYFYGILRANLPSALSLFIFDSAALGLFAAQLPRRLSDEDRARIRRLTPWLTMLIGWPVLLLLIPNQDPMVRMVGLRASIFLLPFVFLGARLHREDVHRLTLWLAGFNLVALAFGTVEFLIGIEPFFPRNAVTELIYRSNDVNTGTLLGGYRIPATFANSASYAGMMVITTPFFLGLWPQVGGRPWTRRLLGAALVACVLGVFMAASRSNFLVLLILLVVSTFRGRLGAAGLAAWTVSIGALAWTVAANERLFARFMSLSLDTFVERLSWSVNEGFIKLAFAYPLGNGLGGGGSSMPYFLQPLIRNPIAIENQYGAILVEQGIPGLVIWVAFLLWVFARRTTPRGDPWRLGRSLAWYGCAAYFGLGLIGVGTLTSVPFSVVLLLLLGWISVPQSELVGPPLPHPEQRPTAPRTPDYQRV